MDYNGVMPTYALPYTASIAAHRGWHQDGAPKNSIRGLEAAAANGIDAVEIDVRRLRDGTLVVHHDATLPDGRKLADVDLPAISQYAEIPTLDEWAKRAGELHVNGLVELKESGYEQEVVDTLLRHMKRDTLEFFSFKPAATRALSRIVPDRPVGLLSDLKSPARTGARLVQDAVDAKASFLGLNVRQTADDVLTQAIRNHLGVKVWTVDLPEDLMRLIDDYRVSTVITDKPALAKEIREKMGAAMRSRGQVHLPFDPQAIGTTLRRAATTIR